MTFAALCRRGVERQGLLVDDGYRRGLVLGALCDGSEDRHLPFAVRACAGRYALPPGRCAAFGSLLLVFLDQGFKLGLGIGLSGLSEYKPLLGLHALGSHSLAGLRDGLLTEERCLAQDGACKSA